MSGIRGSILMFSIMLCSMRAGGQTVLEPLNQLVALAGELREVHGYGPPGYGENKKVDTPITYWVLELPNAVNTVCTPEKPQWEAEDCKATKQLKLFFPTLPANNGLELKAKAMKGHRVIVTGVLHRADTVGEITPIYMNVAELQSVQKPVPTSPKP
jgi:hypothetical protein